jgi:hypothetical protein
MYKETKEIRMLMVKVPIRRHDEIIIKSTVNGIVQFLVQNYIVQEDGIMQTHVWDPGKLQKTTATQHDSKARKQLQNKVWDPLGVKKMKIHDQEVMKIFNYGSMMQEQSSSKTKYIWKYLWGLRFS